MNQKQCKYSGNWFFPKRNNQSFENNKARSNYHNKKYRKLYAEVNKTNKLLLNNYKLLFKLIGHRDFMEVEKKILAKLRYDFSLSTGIEEEDGIKSFLQYNYRLTFITNEKILIENRYENKRFI
ncbi:hypothetical protein [uncultured Flavobacterium sp.]|uniref:hypothetical protein n=1 Tax=uncultured Flavobacterium sp. TaxID=165435 RepID=UPI0030EF065E|tara:strand:- start:1259 stop:1630 length:372 start_codon:yes stop_codon:yes gene_type:complete